MAIRVTWTPGTDNPASYNLYSGATFGGTFTLVANIPHTIPGSNYDTASALFFYDDVTAGSSTWFKLSSVDALTNESILSDAFQAGTSTISELTTVSRLKEFLGITATTDDALLGRLVKAASDWFQSQVGRSITRSIYVESHDGDGGRQIRALRGPMVDVLSVSVDDVAIPARATTTGAGYVVKGQQIVLTYDYAFHPGIQNVEIVYEAGYSPIPNDVEQAVLEVAATRYRERTRLGVMSNSVGGESISYQTTSVPISVQSVIDTYKRMPLLG